MRQIFIAVSRKARRGVDKKTNVFVKKEKKN